MSQATGLADALKVILRQTLELVEAFMVFESIPVIG